MVSAGGLGESLVFYVLIGLTQTRTASVALADYLDSVSDGERIVILNCIQDIIKSNIQNDRVIIPAIETVARLFEENIFVTIENYKYTKFFPI